MIVLDHAACHQLVKIETKVLLIGGGDGMHRVVPIRFSCTPYYPQPVPRHLQRVSDQEFLSWERPGQDSGPDKSNPRIRRVNNGGERAEALKLTHPPIDGSVWKL